MIGLADKHSAIQIQHPTLCAWLRRMPTLARRGAEIGRFPRSLGRQTSVASNQRSARSVATLCLPNQLANPTTAAWQRESTLCEVVGGMKLARARPELLGT